MEKISPARNKWVKEQLDLLRDNVDKDELYQLALMIEDNVHDKNHLTCLFPKANHGQGQVLQQMSQVCIGSSQIIEAIGRDEPLKPIDTPGRGSCWAAAFLLATVGQYNQFLIHELRLSALLYLILNQSDIQDKAEEREIYVDFKQDILDLTAHTGKNKYCLLYLLKGFSSS